jgi:hypothetical protein
MGTVGHLGVRVMPIFFLVGGPLPWQGHWSRSARLWPWRATRLTREFTLERHSKARG